MSESEPVYNSPTHQEILVDSLEAAKQIVAQAVPADTCFLLDNTDVLMYGEAHNDYAIPAYLATQVEEHKKQGVTSFGFEINPTPSIQAIIDDINAGKVERIPEIDWSLGFGNALVRQNKNILLEKLVKAGIKIYAFASWSNQTLDNESAQPYSKQTEEAAAAIIKNHSEAGKTIVLVGSQHAQYEEGKKGWNFPHTADCVRALGLKSRSVLFNGGMNPLGEYERSPESRLRAAWREKQSSQPMYLSTPIERIRNHSADGIIFLPIQPFLGANEPIPNS